MRERRPLDVVLCWHMHQPQYRSPDGTYQRPWTYLHAIKDYTDMAAHLEAIPGARAVINFSTILIEQIGDYAARIGEHLESGREIGDPLLDALSAGAASATDRTRLLQACLKANEKHMIEANPLFASLADQALAELRGTGPALSDQALNDLLCWYHLVWFGETVRLARSCPADLIDKGAGFTEEDRRSIVVLIGELMKELLPRYHALAEQGTIEISITPHTHPMLPLMLDFDSARDAMPGVALPAGTYPDGYQRCKWQLDRALASAAAHLKVSPKGCWPSEGGLSDRTLDLLESAGFAWTASGTATLRHSLGTDDELSHLSAWRRDGDRMHCFFRDDVLSDLIGFSYSSWDAGHAVGDLVARLEEIADNTSGLERPVVSIILDGENAWDYYPRNAFDFLRGLYMKLAGHPRLNLTTFSGHLERGVSDAALPALAAGSWVSGNFKLWIGHPDKNRAWTMLMQMRAAVDPVRRDADPALKSRIDEQVAVCEGSDWAWWFGDDNARADIEEFDALYRDHLRSAWLIAGLEPPSSLNQPVCRAPDSDAAARRPAAKAGAVMRESDS